MKKRGYVYGALTALMTAAVLLTFSCKQPEQGGNQGQSQGGGQAPGGSGQTNPGGGQTNPGGSGSGSTQGSADITGSLEFSDTLRKNSGAYFGHLTVWISDGQATVRFKNASDVEYGGNGKLDSSGAVKFSRKTNQKPPIVAMKITLPGLSLSSPSECIPRTLL